LGVDVNVRKNTTNETPAHFCLNNFESLKLLLENGADPNIQDRWEGTLLDRALIRKSDDGTVELLRKYGARKTKDWIADDR
jgi:ankyrin repeat protein